MKLRALALTLLCSSAQAGQFEGLIELPKLFEKIVNDVRPLKDFEPTPIAAYTSPETKSAKITILSPAQLESSEIREGWSAARVFEVKNEFYAVRYEMNEVWIHKKDAGKFWSYPALMKTYGTMLVVDEWDRKIYQKPESKGTDVEGYYNRSIIVKDVKMISGKLWVEVESRGKDCRPGNAKLKFKGWVKGHGNKGEPSIWYHSRGCTDAEMAEEEW